MKDITKLFKNPLSSSSSQEKLEKKILEFLDKDFSPQKIFEKIKNHPNFEQVSCFLYNSGLDKTLLKFSFTRLQKNKPIAWAYVLKLFSKYKITPNKKMEKMLFHYWLKNKDNHSSALFACKEWGDISPEFQHLRLVYIQGLEEKNTSEEGHLLEQLEFVQAQELIKEEEEIIAKLLFINPNNPDYKILKKELEEKKALLTIQKQKKGISKDISADFFRKAFSEQQKIKESWFSAILFQVKKNPKNAKDLSFFLYFCGWPDKALEVLETHISQISDYWFYLDWTLETKQYTKGLELINRLFKEMKGGEAFLLPLLYMKSQMLYALGKKAMAVEYLTAIAQVQPDYKSAQYLLDKWSNT